MTSALQNAPTDGSSDPNEIIKDAIVKALQGGDAPTADPTSESAPPPPPGDGRGKTRRAEHGASKRQAFFETLQKYGVTPEQFRQDLIAALKEVRGNGSDGQNAVQTFPAGNAVDATS